MVARFAFDEQIAAQPDAVAAALDQPVPTLDLARPIVFTGIGTSLHACRVAAAWVRLLTDGRVRPVALDAYDVALTEPLRAEDQLIVVSHRGNKRYPAQVLAKARAVGAATLAVTGQSDVDIPATTVLRTCAQERASTHTVSYTTALAVLARLIVESVGEPAVQFREGLRAVPAALATTLALPLSEASVRALSDDTRSIALVVGAGLDAITAEEAALKIKEGTYRWAEGMGAEFALHGPPAVFTDATVGYLIRPASPDGERVAALARLLARIGGKAFIAGSDADADLPFAAVHPLCRPFVVVAPFQRLVSAAAALLGSNPDLTHLEAEPWGSAISEISL
jgi:glucosamine--fructose-6-phosphate aminotransferase (isomerizing)